MTYNVGPSNLYAGYLGQCTYWAADRYHQLTGIWVPWTGNANQWLAGAQSNGWQWGYLPPRGIPSIICLQPNAGQGLAGLGLTFGHVAIVEQVNNDGTVSTSDMNWHAGPVIETVDGYPVTRVIFEQGSGVTFLWASGSAKAKGPTFAGSGTVSNVANVALQQAKKLQLVPNASVTNTLAAFDNYLQITNPFDIDTEPIQDTALGFSFTDPSKWLMAVSINIWNDLVAISIRVLFFFLGLFLLYKVISHFVDFSAIAQQSAGAINAAMALAG